MTSPSQKSASARKAERIPDPLAHAGKARKAKPKIYRTLKRDVHLRLITKDDVRLLYASYRMQGFAGIAENLKPQEFSDVLVTLFGHAEVYVSESRGANTLADKLGVPASVYLWG